MNRIERVFTGVICSVVLVAITLNSAVGQATVNLSETKLFSTLPESCPTPDSFTTTSEGKLLLTCPNYASKMVQGRLMQWGESGEFRSLGDFYLNDEKVNVSPMGIVASDKGEIYMCGALKGKGRVFKVDLAPDSVRLEVIAKGIQGANGIRYFDGMLFVTVPSIAKLKKTKNVGGVYRFNASDRDIQINGDSTDTNLIFTVETQNPDRQFGLDGIAVNKKGDLFIGDFGDATIYRLKMKKGEVKSSEVFCKLPNETGVDGICFDSKGNLYLAGFSQNEIWVVDKSGNFNLLAKNGDSNGENGQLDQPADVFVYQDKLLISNFDLMVAKGMINTAHGKPFTISYIEIK